MRITILELGDEVLTTAIVPGTLEEQRLRVTKAKIRRIEGIEAEVIYGYFYDRAWVPLSSCRFVKKGILTRADLADTAPICY